MSAQGVLTKLWRWAAGAAFAVFALIGVSTVWINYANSIKETPTCISFKASGTIDAKAKALIELEDIFERAGLMSRVEREGTKSWESPKATATYYSDREIGGYSMFICQKQHDTRSWQDMAKKVESVLQKNSNTVAAWLQRNNVDFKCDPNCSARLGMPVDFEELNRTLLSR